MQTIITGPRSGALTVLGFLQAPECRCVRKIDHGWGCAVQTRDALVFHDTDHGGWPIGDPAAEDAANQVVWEDRTVGIRFASTSRAN